MNKITFSVIIPTYNRYANGLLREAIESVLGQNGDNFDFEIIAVDDASPDGLVQEFEKKYQNNKKIKFLKLKKTLGTPGAIKEGIKNATGDFIVILGDDDLLPKDSLKIRAKFLEQNPDLDWFYGKTQLLNTQGRPIKTISQSEEFEDYHYARMFLYNYIQGGTTTVKRDVYNQIVWPGWLKSRDDDFIAFELVRPGKYKFKFLDEVLYGYRAHNTDVRQSEKNLESKGQLDEMDRKIRYELHDPDLAFLADKARKSAILESELKEREERLNTIYSSIFWKLSWPLRYIKRKIR